MDEDRDIQEVEQVAVLILMCSPKPMCGNLIPIRAMLGGRKCCCCWVLRYLSGSTLLSMAGVGS